MKLYSYPVLVIKNTHGVVAYLEGLDNVELYGEGRTIREVKAALRRAFEFYLERCRKEHVPVPDSNVTHGGLLNGNMSDFRGFGRDTPP